MTLGKSKAITSTARGSNEPIPNSNEENRINMKQINMKHLKAIKKKKELNKNQNIVY
jgi:hypothetical protein